MTRRFQMVDVFGGAPFTGNPVAVVADAEGLGTAAMQAVTRWFNLSETAFLLAPSVAGADYRVRIFTLERELPFAGHPTLGSAHAWLRAGGQPRDPAVIVQQCEAGLVEIRRSGDLLAFAAPPLIRSGPVDAAMLEEVAGVLRIDRAAIVDAAWVDNGPGWVAVLLADADAVLAVDPVRHHRRRIELGIVGPHPAGAACAFEIRALFSDRYGAIVEDPVTGSLNASVAGWLIDCGRAVAPFTTAQGTAIGRSGRVQLSRDDRALWIGGATRTLVDGVCDC